MAAGVSVLVVGSLNMDLSTYVSRTPKPGETIMGERFVTGCGGKGANQAFMAALLEQRHHKIGETFGVAMVAKVGEDAFGKEMSEKLRGVGADVSQVSTTNKASSGVAQITVSSDGMNSIIVVPGANGILGVEDVRRAEKMFSSAKVLLLQGEVSVDVNEAALALGRQHKVLTILNTAPAAPIKPSQCVNVDILCANESELSLLTSLSVGNSSEAEVAARKLQETLNIPQVLVTLGASGSLLVRKGEKDALFVPTKKVKAVDTTGAGDCFLGAFAYFLAHGVSIESAISKANDVASVSVTRPGAQSSYPTADELLKELFHDIRA
jgi:ribokinase